MTSAALRESSRFSNPPPSTPVVVATSSLPSSLHGTPPCGRFFLPRLPRGTTPHLKAPAAMALPPEMEATAPEPSFPRRIAHYKKAPLTRRIFWTSRAVVACKNILAGGWAFPAAHKDGAQIFAVLEPIPADKYAVERGRQARHQVMPRYITGGISLCTVHCKRHQKLVQN